MPKLVDHDQRRAELARAVWAVISRDGIEGATVRKVADEAGVSIGGLRHYFDSQRGLLRFAAEAVATNAGARLTEHLCNEQPGMRRAQLLLEELLPLDDERRVEVDVWSACLMRARVDRSLDGLRKAAWEGERHACRIAVADCCAVPPPAAIGDELPRARLEQRARHLHIFVDGLTLQAATYPRELPAAEVRRMLRAELELVSGSAQAKSRKG
ncbi:TetR/AcrR family transcriptional regulator [Saccharopolyspora sp. NPDC050389]|uniref:TetR/AcrR family transcriptional regulator n=1 Tax=Saccharopolyspora sp. NPDC050389 TaxID=3155516 RepID=UPI0033FAF286